MDRYRPYNGKRSISRHRHASPARSDNSRSSRRAIKLFICAGLFVVAAMTKLLFPAAFDVVGDKINSVVNYRAALTALGQGISGEKKFTAALGEAFTYAFTGESAAPQSDNGQVQVSDSNAADASPVAVTSASDSAAELDSAAVTDQMQGEEAAPVFNEEELPVASPSAETEAAASGTDDEADSVSNAVIAAFLESQEEYSDYAIPAGVTYEMPRIGIDFKKPAEGVVSSSFGYRIHPTEKTVKFHYGTDIANKKGTPITAFADGKVIAAGESTTLGNYVIIYHGDVESEYAHCGSISVTSGQTVKKGDKIATMGDTGNATETCLHFELKANGQYVNPEYYVQWK